MARATLLIAVAALAAAAATLSSPGRVDAAPPSAGTPSSVAFYYQRIDAATDLGALAGAELVVTRSQDDERLASRRIRALGARAYRYTQLYWAPVGVAYDGIDLARTPGWSFCTGDTPPLGRIDAEGKPWQFLDLNERAAWEHARSWLRTVQSWGYAGIMLDRGFAATVSGRAADGSPIWNRASTCTEDPVVPGARFADRYVALAAEARSIGLEVMFNSGTSPYDPKHRSRPDPADPRCDLVAHAPARAWAACPRLTDLASVVTSFLDEGFSRGTDEQLAEHLQTGTEAERRGTPPVVALVKAPGTGAEQRREAVYRWARARLFPVPVGINTGDDGCPGVPGPCLRNGMFPDLAAVRLGAPTTAAPRRSQCSAGSDLRCVYERTYAAGRVIVNATPDPRTVPLPAAPLDARDVGSGEPLHRRCAGHVDLAPWSARILVDAPASGPTVSGYTVDGFGGLHGFGERCVGRVIGPYWAGWDIARGVAATGAGSGGYVLDGFGGLHPFRAEGTAYPAWPRRGPYWRGWDVARGVALLPGGTGGYVLDGFGGLHPFAVGAAPLPPPARGGPYWRGWDIARGVVLLPDGSGGYVVDGFGVLHRFSVGARPARPNLQPARAWPGDDRVRGVALRGDGRSGYLLDGFGRTFPFAASAPLPPRVDTARWPGWPIARGIVLTGEDAGAGP